MTGPLAKADALLSAQLAPWLELSARKAPAGAEAAPPVERAPPVDNDVLLPARANLHPQAAAPLRAALPIAATHTDAGGTGIALSSAARAIFAPAAGLRAGQAGPVRGSVALWPVVGRQAPAADALASALSRQVSESGLFYESHLAEFAGGSRSLAQMQREPQAGLARGAAVREEDPAGLQQRPSSGVLPVAAAQASAVAMPASPASAVAALRPEMPSQQEFHQANPTQATGAEIEPGTARMQGAPAVSVDHALSRFEHLASASQLQAAAPVDAAMQASPAEAPAAAAAVIHPQAATLVHQQLDLLASSMFRWSGEAWPGVPMEWTVQEEGARQSADEAAEGPLHWSTTLSLDLPRLGQVKVALKLNGSSVHARLAATQVPTADRLRTGAQNLARRMSDTGLELQNLELGLEAAAP